MENALWTGEIILVGEDSGHFSKFVGRNSILRNWKEDEYKGKYH